MGVREVERYEPAVARYLPSGLKANVVMMS